MIESVLWTKRLRKLFNDSFIDTFILEWFSVFKRIDWVNDSTDSLIKTVICRHLLAQRCNLQKELRNNPSQPINKKKGSYSFSPIELT